MLPSIAFADCNFATDITALPDGGYRYSKDCHIQVGVMKKQNDNYLGAITDLKKAITLKDLAITESDARTQNWMDTSFRLEKREESIESLRKQNDWIYFGLGALAILGAGFATAALTNRH